MGAVASLMNEYGRKGTPFLFILDFDLKNPIVRELKAIDPGQLLYDLNGVTNATREVVPDLLEFEVHPVSEKRYREAFQHVISHINYGNSFLLNLTMPSMVKMNLTLREVFHICQAKYKLWFSEEFVVFSPETFIRMENGRISAFPMKGTIDASVDDAENKLRSSRKELAEHFTIVDLIRNDLSIVAHDVQVKSFQHIDRIRTNRKELLQMSSEITGTVRAEYRERLGDMILQMLPAGSITGAPKKKTIEVIREAEQYDRGYYTGIFGIFDGKNLDSGVMIRYLERSGDAFIYKSGGGITALSKVEDEYRELLDKIYLPL